MSKQQLLKLPDQNHKTNYGMNNVITDVHAMYEIKEFSLNRVYIYIVKLIKECQ